MIGRWIDRAAVTLIGTTGLYVFFIKAGTGIPVGCLLTFICLALARYVIVHCPRRISRARVEAALEAIAMMGECEAETALKTLAKCEDGLFLIRHPAGTFTLDELFGIWREMGNDATIVVTCAAEEVAARFAATRGMTLIDKRKLVKEIRRTGLYVTEGPEESVAARLKRAWDGVSEQPVRPRMILYSVSLLGAYLATGRALCLACGLGLLGVAGAKLIQRYA